MKPAPASDPRPSDTLTEPWVVWHEALALLAILLLTLGLYSRALFLPPTDHDDTTFLRVVAAQPSPLYGLQGDWGLQNNRWRPLHAANMWISMRVFGVWALPRQAGNLALHVGNLALLYALARRLGRSRLLACLICSLCAISLYTASPTLWVSDRPTLWVTFAVLLLIRHWVAHSGRISPIVLVATAGLALMAKESGLVVALLGVAMVLIRPKGQARTLVLSLALILGYYLLRRALLPADQIGPHERGYILGVQPYDEQAVFPPAQRLAIAAENVVKGVLAAWLPVLNRNGGFYRPFELLLFAPTWGATAALGLATLLPFRRTTGIQRLALLVILLNALVHFSLFRHRNMYLSQYALALIVIGTPHLDRLVSTGFSRRERTICMLLALLALSNSIWVPREVDYQVTRRAVRLAAMQPGEPIADAILDQYSTPRPLVAPGLLGRPW